MKLSDFQPNEDYLKWAITELDKVTESKEREDSTVHEVIELLEDMVEHRHIAMGKGEPILWKQ